MSAFLGSSIKAEREKDKDDMLRAFRQQQLYDAYPN